jgi:hypothetical protein
VIKSGDVSWSFASFSIAESEKMYIVLVLLLVVVVVVAVAVVVKILIPYPILNLFSLTRYFFINNRSIKLYIDTLNLYRYRIYFYDIASFRFIDIK